MASNGLKLGSFHFFRHPKSSGFIFGKKFLTHFFVPKKPIFKPSWDFKKAKTSHHELKTHLKTLVLAFNVVQIHL